MTMAWRCGLHRHVAHRLGCGECQRCHPLGMRRWRCCVEGRVKLYLGTLLALWRSPRCASAGMNLRSVRNNDTSTWWLREGRVAERWDGGQRERKRGYVQGEKEVEREGDGNVKHDSSSFSLPLGFCEDHRTAPENVPNAQTLKYKFQIYNHDSARCFQLWQLHMSIVSICHNCVSLNAVFSLHGCSAFEWFFLL